MWKRRRTYENKLSASYTSCMIARHPISLRSMVHSSTIQATLLCVWNIWTAGERHCVSNIPAVSDFELDPWTAYRRTLVLFV